MIEKTIFILFVGFLLQGCASQSVVEEPLVGDDLYKEAQSLTFDFIKNAQHSDDLSGIAWVPTQGHYYLLLNAGGFIYEVDRHFQLVREVRIYGFDDPEDLTFLEMTPSGPRFAIVEEQGTIAMGVIPDAETHVDRATFELVTFDLKASEGWSINSWLLSQNKGAEGLAFNKNKDIFYVVKEKWPLDVLEVSYQSVNTETDARTMRLFSELELKQIESEISDLSSIYYDADSETLYLLSDESRKILTVDLNTRIISVIKDQLALPQPEGMTFGEGGKLIVVSEPYYGLVLERP